MLHVSSSSACEVMSIYCGLREEDEASVHCKCEIDSSGSILGYKRHGGGRDELYTISRRIICTLIIINLHFSQVSALFM